MIITNEIKILAGQVNFVPITTVSDDGEPHLIVVGGIKEFRDDDIIVFTPYKMVTTQNNIKANGKVQVVFAQKGEKSQGFRITGKGSIEGNEVLVKAEKAESLL